MPKLNDLGKTYENEGICCDPVKKSKEPEVYYPSETFNEKQMPALAGKKTGDTVTITIEAKIKSIEIYDKEGKEKKTEYRLEFRKGYCDESTRNDNKSKTDKIAEMGSGEKKKMFPDEEEN